jgi:tetrahydrodipicolinate N-succinyltransferase
MRSAFGFGIASTASTGEVLDVWFDSLGIGKLADNNGPDLSEFTGSDAIREVTKSKIAIEIDLDTPPKDVADAYLRLHLLSHRIVKPHGQSLDGIFGILSGGGKQIISIGERCLLGANAGLGISLGNDCVVESGTYITAGSKITLPDGEVVKASELSGANNLLFRRNSKSGALEALPKTGNWGGLNSVLHAN